MTISIQTLLAAGAVLASFAAAQSDLVGTWTSKSRTVYTGPGFYDPVNDKFMEPTLPGISYSFTDDGWYEVAYYRAAANPSNPKCPSAAMQWQHGKYAKNANGSLTLTPLAIDGRELQSDPCSYKQSIYIRYNQPEYMEKYEVVLDDYHNVKRLNLYKWDGAPQMPLYIAYSPVPQMLPTQTLNPTASATATGAKSTSTSKSKQKRSIPEEKKLFRPSTSVFLDPDHWWWFGVVMTSLGAIAYTMF